MSSIGSFLAENLLILLAFDPERSKIIRGTVDVQHFGGQYREIAVRIYDYIDKYKEPPKEHIADILQDKLESESQREARLYVDIIDSIHEAKDTVNGEYVMTQLETFVRRQSLRSVAIDLTKALQRDTEESLEEAARLIASANQVSLKVFDAGTRLSNVDRALSFLLNETESFPTGVPELDKRGFGPTRKEMLLYIADKKTGKTWWLGQLAKSALRQRLKVAHVTLEMSEERIAQRYMQAFFALAKREETYKTLKFDRDKLGRITDFNYVDVKPNFSFDNPDAYKKLEKLVKKWSPRILDNIIVKQFPTGQLTVAQLKAYLDNLEVTERFTPDLVILDYPDLMKIDTSNYRISLGQIFKDIRGIAVERNLAMAVVSQSHREASKAKLVDAKNVAEAYSKTADADVTLTYSQTSAEKTLGLARLHVAAGRNDQDGITIAISQAYGIGQFVIDSNLMVGNYFDIVEREQIKNLSSSSDSDDDDEDDDE